MKKTLHYLKLRNCIIIILPVITMLDLQAQDYLISIAGSGASTTVDSVKIENLMQGTKLKMKGSDILRLTVVTGIEDVSNNETGKISFYPNPMKDYSRMQFVLPEPGETLINLYDISGRKIAQTRDLLFKGEHTYRIQGIEEGIYFVRITSGKYSFLGRLICSESQNRSLRILYENTIALQEKQNDSKSTNEEINMQYTTGDRLKLTGISGIYSTVVIDVPSETKTITFDFIACTDGDGNNYPIVKIGTAKGTKDNSDTQEAKSIQIWMAENLGTTKYNDGTAIPLVKEGDAWGNLTTPGYCWYKNDEVLYKNVYGGLYNWFTVNTGKLCPSGWHVPSDIEWTTLINNLGGPEIAGGKMKETGISHWDSPNTGATNECGFTALPGGYRCGTNSGLFTNVKVTGHWYSSTVNAENLAVYRTLTYGLSKAAGSAGGKNNGYSIRCVKD